MTKTPTQLPLDENLLKLALAWAVTAPGTEESQIATKAFVSRLYPANRYCNPKGASNVDQRLRTPKGTYMGRIKALQAWATALEQAGHRVHPARLPASGRIRSLEQL